MEKLEIVRLKQLPRDDLQPLLEESREQGYEFVDRLVTEYVNGINQFQKSGERIYGVYRKQQLIAIGGLNRDPYLDKSGVARVRHVYVLTAWRNQGVGKKLVETIIEEAKDQFSLLTLRTFSNQADGFYRALGFQKQPEIKHATHHLALTG
jgi:GNAT superfamily N-acetyltransferase